MNRRDLLQMSAALGLAAPAGGIALTACSPAIAGTTPATSATPTAGPAPGAQHTSSQGQSEKTVSPLTVPADGIIPVAFLISDGAVLIDFVGPWEVFGNVRVPGPTPYPFHNYTVSESLTPIRANGGMTITPEYTLATAPPPKVVVIPAQKPPTEAVLSWIRRAAQTADLTMSVCTGAYLLAQTGLLSGKEATTYHGEYAAFAAKFPDIHFKRGARFVDLGNLASAGGLSSGIDLALHVAERYFGRDVATAAAYNLEYQGQGWLDPNSNSIYAQARASTDAHPLCPVCNMDIDKTTAPQSTYHGKTYYFCMASHKAQFDANPKQFVSS